MYHNVPASQKREPKHPQRRIGIDTRNTALPHGTGVSTYAKTLGDVCRQLGFTPQFLTAESDPSAASRFVRAVLPSQKLTNHFSAPDPYRVAHIHFKLTHRLMKLRMDDPPDLMHWTYPLPMFLAGSKNIVTIHDLIPLHHAELTTINGQRLRKLLGILLRQFDGIVTISDSVRTEIINLFGVSPSRVRTLYQGLDLTWQEKQGEKPEPPICPPGSFVMIGSVEKRKNIHRLIAAHRESNVAAPLVIIGPDGNGASEQLADMDGNVIRIPYAPRAALLSALKQARALLFPSLAEGFGLPIIEAFALGVPVMTSRAGATEEIAGGAALLVNPENINEIADAIRALAQDNQLCARFSAYGLARAKFFSMEAYAERVSSYYAEILNS